MKRFQVTATKVIAPITEREGLHELIWSWKAFRQKPGDFKVIKTDHAEYNFVVSKDNQPWSPPCCWVWRKDLASSAFVCNVTLFRENYRELGGMQTHVPMSYTHPNWRGLNLGKSVYKWALHSGYILKSDREQTKASNGLWQTLSKQHPFLILLETDLRAARTERAGCTLADQWSGNMANTQFAALLFPPTWTQAKVHDWARKERLLK